MTMILNLMLGKKRGGLEQAALDYAEALRLAKLDALTVISPGAWLEAQLVAASVPHESLTNWGNWDFLSPGRLRRVAEKHRARVIICHGNRALKLALRAFPAPRTIHIIAVSHNYSTRRFVQADQCFAITAHLAKYLADSGVKSIAFMPNMVRVHEPEPRPPFRHPPVIGAMGRFVAKKGFPTFIEALAILRDKGVPFTAILGGDGEDAASIDSHIARYQLGGQLQRIGWVKDKTHFFDSIDLFILPSLQEPFGIVLLEAMMHAVPVISSDAEGPAEILHNHLDGYVVPKGDPVRLADAIEHLLSDPVKALATGIVGYHYVAKAYSMDAMAHRLHDALSPYISKA